jgi:hypothetical protein
MDSRTAHVTIPTQPGRGAFVVSRDVGWKKRAAHEFDRPMKVSLSRAGRWWDRPAQESILRENDDRAGVWFRATATSRGGCGWCRREWEHDV